MKPGAGAAADLRHSETCLPSLPGPAALPAAAGFWDAALEVFTVAAGLTVFGLVAGFFLVLA